MKFKVFPYKQMMHIYNSSSDFLKGGEGGSELTVVEKIENDAGGIPHRQLVEPMLAGASARADLSSRGFTEVKFDQKNPRRANPLIFKSQDTLFDNGFLFLFGAIDSVKGLHGGILLNRKGEIVHTISFDDESVLEKINKVNKKRKNKFKYKPLELRFPHGVFVLDDGSILFNDGDPGNSIRRIDWCGKEIWSRLAYAHHSIEVRDNFAWHWEGGQIVATDVETGVAVKRIDWTSIVKANSDMGGLEIRKTIRSDKNLLDPVHANDVDPLPAYLAKDFPDFKVGDLLVSLRSIDMIAIIDPNTLKIKWWRIGATKRQHDADWQPGGQLTIFDNQMVKAKEEGISRIVSIDTGTLADNVIYSGADHNAYTWMRGKHQVLSNDSILLTLPQQGRVILVSSDGGLLFDFRNKFDDKFNLLISEAVYIPETYLDARLFESNSCNQTEQ